MNDDLPNPLERLKINEIPGLTRIEETYDPQTDTSDRHFSMDLVESRENFTDSIIETFEMLLKQEDGMPPKRDFEFVFLVNGDEEINIKSPENYGEDKVKDRAFLRELLSVAIKHNSDEPLRFHFIERYPK